MATSFELCMPSSGENNYINLNASALLVNVMGSHLLSYSSSQLMPAVVVLWYGKFKTNIVHIKSNPITGLDRP